MVLFILALIEYQNNFAVLKEDCFEYRLLAISVFMFVWYGIILTISAFTESNDIKGFMIASLPCVFYNVIADLVRFRSSVHYKAFCSIFSDPDTIKF